MERKGIHINVGTKESAAAVERVIGEIAPALGFNWVVLGVTGRFAYQSHPECAEPDSMDSSDARRLAKVARDSGITLIPEYNCLGHQSFEEKAHALLRAHPEFNEAPEMDMHAFTFHNFYSWCPNRMDVYEIVFDLIDELVEAFEAKSLHVGMDEVFVLGECPQCKGTPNAQLFAKAVNDIHGHVVGKRGLEMMMWGDRLLPPSTGFSMWERSNNETEGALDLIPQDIIMCDWHYEVMPSGDYPSVRYFQGKGFRVWPGGWNEEPAVKRLIEVARGFDVAQPRPIPSARSGPRGSVRVRGEIEGRRDDAGKMLGYMATTWVPVAELAKALSGEPFEESKDGNVGKVAACVKLGARMMQL